MTSRILITGSRFWNDVETIMDVLSLYRALTHPVILVSGACPPRWVDRVFYKGADRICEDLATTWGWQVERHPADWGKYGKRAGFIRNSEMVQLGADVCHAFILNASKGATMCADLAEAAGIPVERVEVTM